MKRRVLFTLATVVLLLGLVLLSPYASSLPDGLEWAAAELGFAGDDGDVLWRAAPAPDYVAAGVDHRPTATRLAGIVGTVLAFALTAGLARVLSSRARRGRRREGADESAAP